jgi:hypothetical protein
MTTGSVFKHIFADKHKSSLMQGHYGIAKTFSFMLYAQLSNFIHKYLIQCIELKIN